MPGVVWQSLSVAIGVAGAVALLWALFRDRPSGRRRCGRCWYDMGGTPGLKCPECGREATGENGLHRTRRRWVWAAVALLAAPVALQVAAQPRRSGERWTSWAPTTVLAALVWMEGGDRIPVVDAALRSRWESAWFWQRELVLGTNLWVTWIDARKAVSCRETWPADVPVVVHLTPWGNVQRKSEWMCCRLSSDATGSAEALAAVAPPGTFVCGTGYDPSPEFLHLPAQAGGERTVRFVVSVFGEGGNSRERCISRRTIPVRFRFVPKPEDSMEPLRSDAADAAVRAGIGLRVLPPADYRPSPLCVDLHGMRLPPGTANGAVLEIVRDGEVVGRTDFESGVSFGSVLCELEAGPKAALIAALPPGEWRGPRMAAILEGWSLRFTGSAANSLTDFGDTRYWDGRVEVQLAAILR